MSIAVTSGPRNLHSPAMLRYAITDRSQFGGSLPAMLQRLVTIAPALDYIQIRERDLPAAKLETFARELLAAIPNGPRILINHRADVAIATHAHGVHLRAGSEELSAVQVRELYHRAGLASPIISISCHSLDEVRLARDFAADMILFGPVFEKLISGEKVLSGTGLDLLSKACDLAAPTKVLALGGVTESKIPACLEAGAAGVAAIRLFLQQ
jgi:thiamine-phosphate pyrophosphorylase